MARRFTGSRPRVQGPKRLTQWGLGVGDSVRTSFTATSAALLGSGVTFGSSGTVVRQRGALSAFLDSYTNAGDGFHCAVGIGIVSSAAFTAGIASVPTPITEAAWDGWMYHRFFDLHGSEAAGSTAIGGIESVDFEVDTKAMRKVSDEMTVFAALEVVELGTASLGVYFDSRMLLKLG